MSCLRLLSFSLALLLVLVSNAAAAPHEGYYVGAYFGMTSLNSVEAEDNLGLFILDSDPGQTFALTLGYDLPIEGSLGNGRLELEYNQSNNDLTQATFSDSSVSADGSLSIQSLMFTSFATFEKIFGMNPYAGLGLGAAQVKMDKLTATGQPLIDDKDMVFAGQAGGGVTIEMTPSLRLDIGYRFFLSAKPEFLEADGRNVSVDISGHRAMLGLVWLFDKK
jgi:opacity protein-like surface antigen